MATWVVGDIHGCSLELELLVEKLGLGEEDTLVSVGDLFHRGPDAVGVARTLARVDARFILGNHEQTVLRRVGLAGSLSDGSDRPPLRTRFPPMDATDLVGDGNRPLRAGPRECEEILVFLQGHSGCFLSSDSLDGAGPSAGGQAWWVVHAGFPTDRTPAEARPEELIYPNRIGGRRSRAWFEVYPGPDLVLYGHLPRREPQAWRRDGELVALGLDTGCVYGGELTAYSPELDRFVSVPAREAYAPL